MVLSFCFFNVGVYAQQLLTRKILSQKIEMLMPLDFKQMDVGTIKVKYPNEGSRPSEVYTNGNSSVNFAFTHSAKKVNEDIKKYTSELVDILKKRGITIISQSQQKINGKDFLIVHFNSKALTGILYNTMFFTVLDNRLLMGNYSCSSSMEGGWKNKGDEMIASIKLLQ